MKLSWMAAQEFECVAVQNQFIIELKLLSTEHDLKLDLFFISVTLGN